MILWVITGEIMTFEGAVVKEQGVTFGIVIVKESAIRDHCAANDLIVAYQPVLGVAPVVLMAQNGRGVPKYYGRKDIVAFLANIDFRRIPWRKYTYSA
jgi:hypothetical protein